MMQHSVMKILLCGPDGTEACGQQHADNQKSIECSIGNYIHNVLHDLTVKLLLRDFFRFVGIECSGFDGRVFL